MGLADVYIIQPELGESPFGRMLAEALGDRGVEALKGSVRRIELDPARGECRVVLHPAAALPPEAAAGLTARLLAALSGVTQIAIEPEAPPGGEAAPDRAAPHPAGARHPAPAAAECTVAGQAAAAVEEGAGAREGDDLGAYMEQILKRARDFALLAGEQGGNSNGVAARKGVAATGDVLLGQAIAGRVTPLAEIGDEEKSIAVEGEIFSLDVREMRSGRRLITFDFTDRTDSLGAKLFAEAGDPLAERLRVGLWIRARGSVQHDRFTQELTLLPRDLMVAAPPSGRSDDAPKKRVELHLHTKMSALDGACEIDEVIRQAAVWGHEAIAITDHGVVQAFPDAFEAGQRHGIKVILGIEGYLADDLDKKAPTYHIVLLVKNRAGLRNLYKLVSLSHLEYFYRRPRLPRAVLVEHREGLSVGSACEAGELFRAILADAPKERLVEIARFYDYLEIQPLENNTFLLEDGRVRDRESLMAINRRIVELGEELGLPVVATGDVHFLRPEDSVFRQIIMAAHGFSDVERPTPLYLRTTAEMLDEFAYLGPERARQVVIAHPRAIAKSCEPVRPVPEGLFAPHLPGAEEAIESLAWRKARALYGDPAPDVVVDRLKRELEAIIQNGYATLYWVAHQLVRRSLDDGYLVGSRGSVGSSLVAALCDITEVNPLPPHYLCGACTYSEFPTAAALREQGEIGCGADLPDRPCPRCCAPLLKAGFDIPFETFLGFKGDKVPDIDLNFSGEYQAKAHRHAEELIGKEAIYRAGTVATLADRTAYGYVRKFLEEKGVKARAAEINRLVRGCTGVRKTTGQHPGGLMVVPEGWEIYDFCPVHYPANDKESGVITTHFDFHAVHDTLVKLDILGHDDPTVFHELQALTGVDPRGIPLGDPATLAIFAGLESLRIGADEAGGEVGTLGIPEFGTRFVRQMLIETRPRTVAELVRICGFSHGTNVWANNAQDLIKAGVTDLGHAIANRDDIMLYLIQQGIEPVAAFKIMEAVRKGKGLSPEDEALIRAHGVPAWYVASCHKISYLFPKAHAAAYVISSLRIAYFKVHHPAAFYATYFTVRADEFDAELILGGPAAIRNATQELEAKGNEATGKEKGLLTILEVAREAVARGVRFLPVDLYRSDARRFLITPEGLLCPLVALSGLGASAADGIVAGRVDGPFRSIEELRRRTGITKAVAEILDRCGALAGLPETDQLTLFAM